MGHSTWPQLCPWGLQLQLFNLILGNLRDGPRVWILVSCPIPNSGEGCPGEGAELTSRCYGYTLCCGLSWIVNVGAVFIFVCWILSNIWQISKQLLSNTNHLIICQSLVTVLVLPLMRISVHIYASFSHVYVHNVHNNMWSLPYGAVAHDRCRRSQRLTFYAVTVTSLPPPPNFN